jgi:hypothetical protein
VHAAAAQPIGDEHHEARADRVGEGELGLVPGLGEGRGQPRHGGEEEPGLQAGGHDERLGAAAQAPAAPLCEAVAEAEQRVRREAQRGAVDERERDDLAGDGADLVGVADADERREAARVLAEHALRRIDHGARAGVRGERQHQRRAEDHGVGQGCDGASGRHSRA